MKEFIILKSIKCITIYNDRISIMYINNTNWEKPSSNNFENTYIITYDGEIVNIKDFLNLKT